MDRIQETQAHGESAQASLSTVIQWSTNPNGEQFNNVDVNGDAKNYMSETAKEYSSGSDAASDLSSAASSLNKAATSAASGVSPSPSSGNTPSSSPNAEKAIGAGIKVGNKAAKETIKATQQGAGTQAQQAAKQEGSTFWGQIKALFTPSQPPPPAPPAPKPCFPNCAAPH